MTMRNYYNEIQIGTQTAKIHASDVQEKQWKELKERLVNSGDHFQLATTLYCDIQMSCNIVESIDLDDFVKIIENQQAKLVNHWRAVLFQWISLFRD